MTRLSRRRALIGGLTLAAAAASVPKIATAQPASELEAQIGALERQHTALIGVFAANLDSGTTVTHRAQQRFAMCSTFKTYAAARVLQLAERGELSLEQRVFVDPAELVINSPVTEARAGGEMTLAELCQAALQRSDNTAANLLLATLGGPQAVTVFARSIGDPESRLDRWEPALNSAIPGDPRDTSTPEALGGGYRNLLAGDVLAAPQRSRLDDWMRANQTSSMRAGLPAGWTSADKTGSGDYASTNDVGVAYGPDGQRILLALMTRTQTTDPNAASLRPLIGELTGVILPAVLA
ncbi:class A beta-lactamase [Mycolicibacterium pulveris]|uniref:class A beta-lactamase n=1 Tax=Mycolicibacterium pulveris TaxID=36813 RepID=UPI003CEC7D24